MEQGQHNICTSLTDNELSEFSKKIEEVFLRKDISLPLEEGEKIGNIKNLIEIFIKDTISTSSKYDIESFIGKQLSQGDITRITNILNDSDPQEINTTHLYSFKEMSKNLIKQHGYQLYDDTKHRITTTDDEKEKKKIILELLKDTKEEQFEVIYSEIQQNCYPIEILQELGIELEDLPLYMMDISQAMKMIHSHKVYQKYGMPWDHVENIFIVKRIDKKPAFLRIYKGEQRKYFINPFYSNNNYPHGEIRAGSRFFIKIPNIN